MSNKYKFFGSIWVLWFFLTLLYMFLTLFLIRPDVQIIGNPIGYFFGFVGLFVPYGLLSLPTFLFIPTTLASLIFFTLSLTVVDYIMKDRPIAFWKRIVLNLIVLFLLTMLVDFMRATPLGSWEIFISGGNTDIVSPLYEYRSQENF